MTSKTDAVFPEDTDSASDGGNLPQSAASENARGEPAPLARRLAGRKAHLLVALAISLFYLASVTNSWVPTPDSALYLMLGENIASGEGYTLWGAPHIHVPPGFPLLLAALFRSGADAYWCLNLMLAITALVALLLVYQTLRFFLTRDVALLLVSLVAFSHAMHLNTIRILSDVPFMLLVWLGIYAYFRGIDGRGGWLVLGTSALLASCTLRAAGLPVLVGAAVGLVFQSRAWHGRVRLGVWLNCLLLMIAPVVAGTTALLWMRTQGKGLPSYGGHLARILGRSPLEHVQRVLHNFVNTAPDLSSLLTGQKHSALGPWVMLFWLPVLLGFWLAWRRKQYLPAAVVFVYVGGLLVRSHLLARYLLPVAPLITLYFIDGVRWFYDRSLQRSYQGGRLAVAMALILLAMNVPKGIRSIERLHAPHRNRTYQQVVHMQSAAEYLRRNVPSGKRFAVIDNQFRRRLAYLSRTWSIPNFDPSLERRFLTADDLEKWRRQNVALVVVCRQPGSRKYSRDRRLIEQQQQLTEVFANDDWQIYALRSQTARVPRLRSRETTTQ